MGSINRSHNEADGGVLLFSGELILLYCDSVQCEIYGQQSVKGRVYLTTHRLVMTPTPYRQNNPIKSLCAPFCAITKCSIEQPIFGANYIEAVVREEGNAASSISFKLRFSKGGAIEFALAMNRAVSAVGRNMSQSMPPPPAYTPSPTAQYYQAPANVYAPGYIANVPMPTQQFPDQPPIGFIYASAAPPPYPGLNGPGHGSQGPPPYSPPQTGYSGYPQQQQGAGGLPGAGGYPQAGQQPPAGYPQAMQQQPPSGYPQAGQQQPPAAYPVQQPPSGGYPQQPASGYPQASQQPSSGYPQPGQQPPAGYPGQQPYTSYPQPGQQPPSVYPQLPGAYPTSQPQDQPPPPQQQQQPGSTNWPTAPSFNPNWQEDKKSA